MQQNEEILNYFSTLKKHSCLGVGYAFVGEDFSLVIEIIKLISCQAEAGFCNCCWDCRMINAAKHPDLLLIEPSGLTIKIENIREAIRFLALKSFRLRRKLVMIKEAQNLTPEAASAFLKTLEEAPENSFIALCLSKLEGLPPTVISRCRKIFLPFKNQDTERAHFGRIDDFLNGRDIFFPDRQDFSSFLWELIRLLHTGLLFKEKGENNQLSNLGRCAIILNSYNPLKLGNILGDLLKIYAAHKSVNMNLALDLIRLKLKL